MKEESFEKLTRLKRIVGQNETTDGRIRLTQFIGDPKEILKVAKRLKLSRLVGQAHETIHYWADQQPDNSHLATARDMYADTRGLCIGMMYCPNGMMGEFALLFEFDSTVSWDEANAAMIDAAEGIAPLLVKRILNATECACCGWREPENLKDGEMCI